MALKMGLTKALQDPKRSSSIETSIKDEVSNLMAKGIMDIISNNDIPATHRSRVIRLWLFHKEKLDTNGAFLKDKSQIVTLSQHRDLTNIGLTYAPTVNPISFFVLMAIAADLSPVSLRHQGSVPQLQDPYGNKSVRQGG
jgi:hypothetical protein